MNGLELMKMINLLFCPKCGSKNVKLVYTSTSIYGLPVPPKDRCIDCRYEELKDHFETINLQKLRDQKIESILNGIS